MAGETVSPATGTKRRLSKQPGPDTGSVTFSVTVRDGMPAFMPLAILEYAKWGYRYVTNHAIYVVFAGLLVAIFMERLGLEESWRNVWSEMPYDMEAVLAMLGVLVFTVLIYFMSSPPPIYLIDFACCRPSDEFKISKKDFIDQARKSGKFDEASLEFQAKVLKSSGIGDETYIPKSIMSPTNCATMKEGRAEASTVIFGALDELFEKCGIRPRDVDILVVNTTRFNPTPSISAMIINKYKMRGNILSFNLGGMGCSAGIIAIDLARDMLNGHPNSLAVVISVEMVTFTWYSGRNPSMLLSNCFFRMGCSALLLSNRRRDFGRAKYQLQHLVRTHRGSDDRSFRSVYLLEDDKGLQGLEINDDVMEVGRQAVKSNISMLGPRMLPLSEKLRLAAIQAWRNLSGGGPDGSKPQILEYKLAFDHICVNASSKAVLDELQKQLGLSRDTMEAARVTLHRFGNTSSSSTWYELAYLEAKEKVQQGDRVWQLTFGSGFKCNTAVWRALRRPKRPTRNNPWLDCLDRYPLAV